MWLFLLNARPLGLGQGRRVGYDNKAEGMSNYHNEGTAHSL